MKVKCDVCKKNLGISFYDCNDCKKNLCSEHKYKFQHECNITSKEKHEKKLEKENPAIKKDKLPERI